MPLCRAAPASGVEPARQIDRERPSGGAAWSGSLTATQKFTGRRVLADEPPPFRPERAEVAPVASSCSIALSWSAVGSTTWWGEGDLEGLGEECPNRPSPEITPCRGSWRASRFPTPRARRPVRGDFLRLCARSFLPSGSALPSGRRGPSGDEAQLRRHCPAFWEKGAVRRRGGGGVALLAGRQRGVGGGGCTRRRSAARGAGGTGCPPVHDGSTEG